MQPENHSGPHPTSRVFLVPSTIAGLKAIQRVTLFGMVERYTVPSHRFVEWWVLAMIAGAVAALFASVWWPSSVLVLIVVGLAAAWRMLEVLTTQLLLFIDFGPNRLQVSGLVVRSARRTVLLAFLNYIEIVLWFAAIYIQAFHAGVYGIDNPHPAWMLCYQSVIGMVGNTAAPLTVQGRLGWLLLSLQTFIGFFMISVVLSRIINSIPALVSQDKTET